MAIATQSIGGLVSGMDTANIIEQLMEIERKPITNLENRITELEAKKEGYSSLNSMMLSFKAQVDILGKVSTYSAKSATSSLDTALGAQATDSAAIGSYSFRVARLAQTHQLTSNGFSNNKGTVGAGEIRIDGAGAYLGNSTKLSELNGGEGVRRGSIRLTDRAGNTATIDLSAAETVKDVVDAISNATGVEVTARVASDGFGIDILDDTGGAGNLIITDFGTGKAATDLGILTTGTAGNRLGDDVYNLTGSTLLSFLNDGRGVDDGTPAPLKLQDNTTSLVHSVDLTNATTMQDVVDAINAVDGGTVFSAAITGRGLTITNSLGHEFEIVTDDTTGSTAADLGLSGTSSGAALSGLDIYGEMDTVLLSSLSGKNGTGINLGDINITDREGTTVNVNLSGAKTLRDVLQAINTSGAKVTAELNEVGNGIIIRDTSGATASNLIIADGGTGSAATDLGLTVNAAVTSKNGGDLDRKYISRATKLSELNGGKGVYAGSIRITDGTGAIATGDLSALKTVGEVIDALNASGLALTAKVNASGDGIEIVNTHATGELRIEESGTGTTAADLNLKGSAAAGASIDGSFEEVITVTATETLTDVMNKIGSSDAPALASIVNDGSGVNPYHLQISATTSGARGRLVIDSNISSLSLQETSTAQDAAMLYGGSSGTASAMLLTSSENTFKNAVTGLTLTARSANLSQSVSITVERNTESIATAMEAAVSAYNDLAEVADILTDWDEEEEAAGLLFGDSAVYNMMDDIQNTFLTTVTGLSGNISQMMDIGVRFKYDSDTQKTRLEFEASTFSTALSNNFESVRDLLVASQNCALSDQNASVSSTNPAGGGSNVKNLINGDISGGGFPATNGYEATNAVNNDQITVTFDKARSIYQLIIDHIDTAAMPAKDYSIKDFTVEYLDATTNKWNLLRTYTGNTSSINYIGLPTGTLASAVRLNVTDTNAPDKKVRLLEIEALEYSGLMANMRQSVAAITDSTDGVFTTADDSLDSRIEDMEATIEDLEVRMTSKEESLIREYASMETALAKLQSQSEFFQNQIAALNKSS